MKLFHRPEAVGAPVHPYEAALRRIYREEGIPEGERLQAQLRRLPPFRLFTCPNRCEPMIYIGEGTPPPCHICGKTMIEETNADAILAESRAEIAANAHQSFALERFHVGDAKAAEAALTRAIGLNPKLEAAYHNRSEVRIALGDMEGALADCDRVIEMNPKAADSYLNRSAAKANMGDFQGGYRDADTALKLGIAFPVAYFNRGICLLQLAQRQRAEVDLERFLQLAPQDGRASMVRRLLRMGKP
jgi:tetratricopeptide (TPR) repeat protein